MTCWEPIQHPLTGVVTRRLGPLTLRVRRLDDEWHAALAYDAPGQPSGPSAGGAADAAEVAWQRWVIRDAGSGLQLTPLVPDRAVVVRPKYPLSLGVGEQALLYVTVPAWLRLTAPPSGAVLLDVPTVQLSKIWFGDFASGELAYSIKTRATRHLDDQPELSWRITCPVVVHNRSPRALLMERLCIHVQHLGVFAGGGRLWTAVVNAAFSGDDQVAEVVYGHEPHPDCTAPTACSQPRSPAPAGLLWRAFRELASITLF